MPEQNGARRSRLGRLSDFLKRWKRPSRRTADTEALSETEDCLISAVKFIEADLQEGNGHSMSSSKVDIQKLGLTSRELARLLESLGISGEGDRDLPGSQPD